MADVCATSRLKMNVSEVAEASIHRPSFSLCLCHRSASMHVYEVRLCGYLLIAISCVQQDVRVPLNEDIAKIFTQTMAQQPCVALEKLPQWVQRATSGDYDFIIAMLLILLPRLETLVIPATRFCEVLIRRDAKWSQEPSFYQPKLPLAKLENVTVGDNK